MTKPLTEQTEAQESTQPSEQAAILAKIPKFGDDPRWWCGSCAMRKPGTREWANPPHYCICFRQELARRGLMQIIRWADNTECMPEDLSGMNHMSDDYIYVVVSVEHEI